MPYEVWAWSKRQAMMTSLMEKLQRSWNWRCAMDSPGSLKAEGLITHVRQLGYHYCSISLWPGNCSVHSQFPHVCWPAEKAVGERMKSQTLHHSQSEWRKNRQAFEQLIWDNARDTFSNYGYVTAKIPKRYGYGTAAPYGGTGYAGCYRYTGLWQGLWVSSIHFKPIRKKNSRHTADGKSESQT